MTTQTYYTVYQITNLINAKIYVGKHRTINPYDDYLGGGSIIEQDDDKYGRENFQKDILHFCESDAAAFEKEAEIVNEEFVDNANTYNLVPGGKGGTGGWDHVDNHLTAKECWQREDYKRNQSISQSAAWNDSLKRQNRVDGINKAYKNPEYGQKISKALSDKWEDPEYYSMRMEQANDPEFRKKHSDALRKAWSSEEKRKEQSEKLKKARSGKDNLLNKKQSELVKGTIWIYNPYIDVAKRIKKNEPIPKGYIKGRRPKNNK